MRLVLLLPAASTWQTEVLIGVVSAVIGGYVLAAIPWFRETIFVRSLWLPKFVWRSVNRKRYVLVWIDAGEEHADRLKNRIRETVTGKYAFRSIASPERVRRFPRRYTAAIVLIDTDVTKLARTQAQSDKIGEWLKKYVRRGGALVGAHDVLWRRVRAPALEVALGGKLTHYEPGNGADTAYHISSGAEQHPMRDGLSDEFSLSDGEVMCGTWQPAAKAIYADEHNHELVVAHEYHEGRCVWLNSGDFGEDTVAASVGEPQENFVKLVTNAIRWTTRTTGR